MGDERMVGWEWVSGEGMRGKGISGKGVSRERVSGKGWEERLHTFIWE